MTSFVPSSSSPNGMAPFSGSTRHTPAGPTLSFNCSELPTLIYVRFARLVEMRHESRQMYDVAASIPSALKPS